MQLRKVGNSIMVAIPSQVIQDLHLRAGDNVLLDVEGSVIKIRKQVSHKSQKESDRK